ncbi:MAG: family 43 glycosylhydrolase [Clostridiales bacterium]|nr:family 43 glycosylhydrolase [Clostridiales bacterium]
MTRHKNPLIEQRADPFILRHENGNYYFTASVPEYDRIELRCAKTIGGLREAAPAVVWRKRRSGEMSCLIWAPELHYVGGRWLIYFAAGHTMDVLDHRIYALCCDDPDPMSGTFAEAGRVETGMDTFALDATAFEREGSQYLVWAQQDPAIAGHSNLYIAKMKDPLTPAERPAMLSRPELPWECRGFAVNEGPAALMKNGRIFVSYSASAVDHNYCMGLLWNDLSADLSDPAAWKKAERPVFASSPENGWYGPGHNCFTKAEDGETDLLVYHARQYANIDGDPLYDPNRHACVKGFAWDESGFPVFGAPVSETLLP